jgi:hypothetical protein
MEGLILTMTIDVPKHIDEALIPRVWDYCDELWIDGELITTKATHAVQSDKTTHIVKYVFKPGVDYIPEQAFANAPSKMRIMSITLPEGMKTLKKSCFYHCHFTGNLILPDSLSRICADALDCIVDGVFHLPTKVKYISSLPISERTKDEIILPEGLVSYTPERIVTDHLHIPSTLRICHSRCYYSNSWQVKHISLDPGNKYFIIREDTLVSLLEEKREKLKKMDEISWNAMLDSAFAGSGLKMRRYFEGKTLHVTLLENDSISFRLGGVMTAAKAAQAFDIANRFHALVNNDFAGKADQIILRRSYYALNQKKCLFNYSFYNGIVDIDLSVLGGKDEMMETLMLSQRFFSCICRLIRDIEKKYGRNHLHFSIK